MVVKVKLYGTLRRFSLPETPGVWTGDIPKGSTLYDLLRVLGTSEKELAAASMDNQIVELDAIIPEHAVITLVTPVGGG